MPIKIQSNLDIESYLGTQKYLIDNHLKTIFQENNNYIEPKLLWDALRYSLLNGGKRIRGILCLLTHESLGGLYLEDCLTVASSIEIIHAMSLIHDDLPSMDNDDLRRGKPSCHKLFGEATAILVGDAMLSLAFQLITEQTKQISETQKLEIINILAKAFSFGLVPGQILDLSLPDKVGKKLNLEMIENIYKLKTAELIKAAVTCGAIVALSNKKETETLSKFGLKVGIAFQIMDDILDITGDTKILGKTSGKDEKQNKLTYPSIVGIEKSKKMASELISQAKSDLATVSKNTLLLSSLADFIVTRNN